MISLYTHVLNLKFIMFDYNQEPWYFQSFFAVLNEN